MTSFSDFKVWGSALLIATLLGSLLIGNIIKKTIKPLRNSLLPTSVLAGIILLLVAVVCDLIWDKDLFDLEIFGGNGYAMLETITYHALALGFIASSFKTQDGKLTKKRTVEIFDTGVTTVSTYLIQGVFGMAITIIAALVLTDFFPAAGILLPFGFGQGTGQAMNYGNIFEQDFGFAGGKSFGLTIAALGFLSASIGGVIHLNIMRLRGRIKLNRGEEKLNSELIEREDEIPMQESVDKLTLQVAFIAVAYVLTYLIMAGLSALIPSMSSTIFGFNFLIGVLSATLIKLLLKGLRKCGAVKKEYTNNFLMTRTGNFFYDIMVVSGIAAIKLDVLEKYWGLMIILGAVGLVVTYAYLRIVCKTLFRDYPEEQFLAMYGMLTGTASTGVILLRELDGDFKTPAADNLVYQNFPAIAFGFPLMLIATFAPKQPILTLVILIVFFLAMNLLLFRSKIFRRRKKAASEPEAE